jgi:hypothetical protein
VRWRRRAGGKPVPLDRVEACSFAQSAPQEKNHHQWRDAEHVHAAPSPSRFRHDCVGQSRRQHAEKGDHVQRGDCAAAASVGELLADHRHSDAEFGGEEYLRQALKDRKRTDADRERGEQRQHGVTEDGDGDDRFATVTIGEDYHEEREHSAEAHDRRHQADGGITEVKSSRDFGRREMKDGDVVALENRGRHQHREQCGEVPARPGNPRRYLGLF